MQAVGYPAFLYREHRIFSGHDDHIRRRCHPCAVRFTRRHASWSWALVAHGAEADAAVGALLAGRHVLALLPDAVDAWLKGNRLVLFMDDSGGREHLQVQTVVHPPQLGGIWRL